MRTRRGLCVDLLVAPVRPIGSSSPRLLSFWTNPPTLIAHPPRPAPADPSAAWGRVIVLDPQCSYVYSVSDGHRRLQPLALGGRRPRLPHRHPGAPPHPRTTARLENIAEVDAKPVGSIDRHAQRIHLPTGARPGAAVGRDDRPPAPTRRAAPERPVLRPAPPLSLPVPGRGRQSLCEHRSGACALRPLAAVPGMRQ